MLSVFGVQLSFVDIGLSSLLVFSLFIILGAFRRISRLEEKLQLVHVNMARDIKMVNQGSIGIGRRFASIEKTLKKSANIATFDATAHSVSKNDASMSKQSKSNVLLDGVLKGNARERSKFSSVSKKVIADVESPLRVTTTAKKDRSTKAEQALSAWIHDHKTA